MPRKSNIQKVRGIDRREGKKKGSAEKARRRWKRDGFAEKKRNKTTGVQGHGFPSMLGFREPRRGGHSKASGRGPGPGGAGTEGTLESLALFLGPQGQFRGVQIRPGAHAASAAAFLIGGLS